MPREIRNLNLAGGMSLSYLGGSMEVVAQLTVFGRGREGSIDIPFSGAMDYHSNVREAVWYVPASGLSTIILGNASEAAISAKLLRGNGETQTIHLAPYATQITPPRPSTSSR
jgi:hypothetical protein